MIVKIKNRKEDCWSYFEGDHIIQHVYGTKEVLKHNTETYYLYDCDSEIKKRVELCINKDKRVVSRILTNQPTYIMNDQGKTIDKLI